MTVNPEIIDEFLDRYEQDWLQQATPDLDEFIGWVRTNLPSDGQFQAISELVALDLEYRWRNGLAFKSLEPLADGSILPTADAYLNEYPEVLNDPSFVDELLWHEFVVRDNCDQRPSEAELARRFKPLHQQIEDFDRERNRERGTRIALVEVTLGPRAGERFVIRDSARIVVGRARDADLVIRENPHLSRYHCRLDVTPPEASVFDLGSKNGTFVNQRPVSKATLFHGDVISIGPTEILLRMLSPSELSALEHRESQQD